MPGVCVTRRNDADLRAFVCLVSLFQNCHRSHEFKANDFRPSQWQRSAETTELFMSNSWTPGYGAWMLNSNQYVACVGHMIWSVQMLTVVTQWLSDGLFDISNSRMMGRRRRGSSAPWDREHKQDEGDRTGERLTCWQLQSLSLPQECICTHNQKKGWF